MAVCVKRYTVRQLLYITYVKMRSQYGFDRIHRDYHDNSTSAATAVTITTTTATTASSTITKFFELRATKR